MAATPPPRILLDPHRDEERPSYTGTIADVYKGHLEDDDQRGFALQVALKDLRGLPTYNDSRERLRENVWRDSSKWTILRHPNVARFYGLSDNVGLIITLVTELYPHGTMMMYLKTNPTAPKGDLMKGVVEGLRYLHEEDIVHCDLRGSNVLIDNTGAPRLVDYGLARHTSMMDFTLANLAGPCRWQAPELFQDDHEVGNLPWSTMSDVYSFGMLVLEMLTEAQPFKEYKQDTGVILAVLRGTIPRRPVHTDMPNTTSADLLDTIWDFLVTCWSHERSDRPTVTSIKVQLENTM